MHVRKLVPLVLLSSVAILLIVLYARGSKGIRVSDEKWACKWVIDKAECRVSFAIHNETDIYHDVSLSIWGHQRLGGAGKAARLVSVGVKSMTLRVEPHGLTLFDDIVFFSRVPDILQVYARGRNAT
jgi:hypothetical protein